MYNIITFCLSFWMFLSWSSKSILNCAIKTIWFLHAAWALLLVGEELWAAVMKIVLLGLLVLHLSAVAGPSETVVATAVVKPTSAYSHSDVRREMREFAAIVLDKMESVPFDQSAEFLNYVYGKFMLDIKENRIVTDATLSIRKLNHMIIVEVSFQLNQNERFNRVISTFTSDDKAFNNVFTL